MKIHLKTHSFKKLNFKCEECAFLGPNETTMEVHYGKKHAGVRVSGFCEFKANNKENWKHTWKLAKCMNTKVVI